MKKSYACAQHRERQKQADTERQREIDAEVKWARLSDGEVSPLRSAVFSLYRAEQRGSVTTYRETRRQGAWCTAG